MQTPPAPPTPPAAREVQGTDRVTVGAPTLPAGPLTSQDIDALRARRGELSNQLTSAEGRRNRMVEEMKNAPVEARDGLQDRIRVLDERIVQLESDIAATGRILTSSEAGIAMVQPQSDRLLGLSRDQVFNLSLAFIFAVLMPLAIAAARMLWRRGAVAKARSADADAAQRMERIEQAVDTIAIEMERVAESQRFVARLLSESPQIPALGSGQEPAQPIRRGDRVEVRNPK